MNRLRIFLFLILALSITFPAHAWFGTSNSESQPAPYNTLAEMADAMAKEIKEGHAGMGLRLYMDREDIREGRNECAVPFAGMLANELERALCKAGYSFEAHNIDQADYALTASYLRNNGIVTVYLKLNSTKNDSYRNLKGIYRIAQDKLPPDCFTEDLDAKLGRLAQKVARGWNHVGKLTVAVNPVVEARKKYSSPFSEYATRKLKVTLSDTPYFRIIDDKPAMAKAATRSIAKDAALDSADAVLAGADAVLEGAYLQGTDTVNMSVSLKDMKGSILANGEENIPAGLIPYSLDNDAAETLAQIADTEHEQSGAVRISTVKGGSYQVFREGETVSFTVQVSKPLYVYIYDINPNGEVSLLYPKQGEPEQPRQPGTIYTIPEMSDSWEIKVEPPFGKDAVKVFASDHKLPFPVISDKIASRSFADGTRSLTHLDKLRKDLSGQQQINGRDLVDWYKGNSAKLGVRLHESTVYVETRQN